MPSKNFVIIGPGNGVLVPDQAITQTMLTYLQWFSGIRLREISLKMLNMFTLDVSLKITGLWLQHHILEWVEHNYFLALYHSFLFIVWHTVCTHWDNSVQDKCIAWQPLYRERTNLSTFITPKQWLMFNIIPLRTSFYLSRWTSI